MDKGAVLDILRRFGCALETRGVRTERMVLFGSYATGTYHEWSDIDVVVVSDDFVGMGYWDRITILSDAICELRAPIEAVAKTVEEWESGASLIVAFATDGELVYQSHP
jgi:uncharacterized protein